MWADVCSSLDNELLASLFGFGQRQVWAFDLPYAALISLRVWSGTPRSAQIAGLWT